MLVIGCFRDRFLSKTVPFRTLRIQLLDLTRKRKMQGVLRIASYTLQNKMNLIPRTFVFFPILCCIIVVAAHRWRSIHGIAFFHGLYFYVAFLRRLRGKIAACMPACPHWEIRCQGLGRMQTISSSSRNHIGSSRRNTLGGHSRSGNVSSARSQFQFR